ncbi:MAG TPA: NUDIX domain-containing protein [Puia sp.]|nr:NUDIX domain-containing protein [Puia sp.]
MPKKSAGILFYRFKNKTPEVLLIHPGGPFWRSKDNGAWSIPKGEMEENESMLVAAKREVKEELGIEAIGELKELSPVKQKSGKIIYCWASQQDIDISDIRSNYFELEWPPKSGVKQKFPEVDQAQWFTIELAMDKIIPGQRLIIEQLIKYL